MQKVMRRFAILFCLLPSAFCISAAAQPVGKLIDVGSGRKLHLVCIGAGSPTVVMESGAAEGFYSWWLVQQKLRDEMRTCSYDRAGFGWSDPPAATRSVSGYVDDLHALLAAAGEKPPFIFAGHSMGGALVQRYYWRYPNDVAAIVAVDPANAEASWPPFPEMKEAYEQNRTRRTKEMEEWRATNKWPQQQFPSQLPRDLRDKLIAASASRNWWEARFGEGALPDLDVAMTPEQRRIGVPLVVISATKWSKPPGWTDEILARYQKRWHAMHEEIASRSKEGTVVDAPTGHSVQLEDPDLVAREIRRIRMRVASKETP